MTGNPPGGGVVVGAQTLRYRQSSLSTGSGVLKIWIVRLRDFSGSSLVNPAFPQLFFFQTLRTIELLHAGVLRLLGGQRCGPRGRVLWRAEARRRALREGYAQPRLDVGRGTAYDWAGVCLHLDVLSEAGRRHRGADQKREFRHRARCSHKQSQVANVKMDTDREKQVLGAFSVFDYLTQSPKHIVYILSEQ
jgi:hypothetical protein